MKHSESEVAAQHPLMHAYLLIFDVAPSGDQILLNREELARAFLAKALEAHPDRATSSGRSRAELTERFRELEAAFKMLSEVLGEQSMAMIAGFTADVDQDTLDRMPAAPLTRQRPRKGWQARPTPTLLERDVADLATMKEAAIRRRLARKANAARANAAFIPAPKVEEEVKPDPRPAVVVPPRDKRFMLGRYLLKSGRITLRQLVDAVLWQRAQRPRVGEVAIEWGIMTKAEVFFVLREKTVDEMFCDVAVRLGFLTSFQRLAILARQRRLQLPIGRYFIEQGILEEKEVDEAADEARRLSEEATEPVVDARP